MGAEPTKIREVLITDIDDHCEIKDSKRYYQSTAIITNPILESGIIVIPIDQFNFTKLRNEIVIGKTHIIEYRWNRTYNCYTVDKISHPSEYLPTNEDD